MKTATLHKRPRSTASLMVAASKPRKRASVPTDGSSNTTPAEGPLFAMLSDPVILNILALLAPDGELLCAPEWCVQAPPLRHSIAAVAKTCRRLRRIAADASLWRDAIVYIGDAFLGSPAPHLRVCEGLMTNPCRHSALPYVTARTTAVFYTLPAVTSECEAYATACGNEFHGLATAARLRHISVGVDEVQCDDCGCGPDVHQILYDRDRRRRRHDAATGEGRTLFPSLCSLFASETWVDVSALFLRSVISDAHIDSMAAGTFSSLLCVPDLRDTLVRLEHLEIHNVDTTPVANLLWRAECIRSLRVSDVRDASASVLMAPGMHTLETLRVLSYGTNTDIRINRTFMAPRCAQLRCIEFCGHPMEVDACVSGLARLAETTPMALAELTLSSGPARLWTLLKRCPALVRLSILHSIVQQTRFAEASVVDRYRRSSGIGTTSTATTGRGAPLRVLCGTYVGSAVAHAALLGALVDAGVIDNTLVTLCGLSCSVPSVTADAISEGLVEDPGLPTAVGILLLCFPRLQTVELHDTDFVHGPHSYIDALLSGHVHPFVRFVSDRHV